MKEGSRLKYRLIVVLILMIFAGAKPSVCSLNSHPFKRQFYFQTRVKHSLKNLNNNLHISDMGPYKSLGLDLMHGTKKGISVGIGMDYHYTKHEIHNDQVTFSVFPIFIKYQYVFDICDNFDIFISVQTGKTFAFLHDHFQE
ncbi:hypothetical protein ACFL6K_06250 [Candidatus Latescibacterota bacterium]